MQYNNTNINNSNSDFNEEIKNFRFTGELKLSDEIDDLDYFLSDDKKPESVHMNDILEQYYKNDISIKMNMNINIVNGNDDVVLFSNTYNKLNKIEENGLVKYIYKTLDLEELFFYNTDSIITIEIKVAKNVENNIESRGNKENEN